MSTFKPSLRKRIHGLDELRGIAIILVMLAHFLAIREFAGCEHLHLGGTAVDLFFIISGFLISKILLADKGEPNFFRRFYVRRVFRILPLYCVTVLAMVIVAWGRRSAYGSWPY